MNMKRLEKAWFSKAYIARTVKKQPTKKKKRGKEKNI